MSFKVIKSQEGTRYVVNVNNIDAIVYRDKEGIAVVYVGSLQIIVNPSDALDLETALGL